MNPDLRYLLSWTVRFAAVLAGLAMLLITAYTWFAAYLNGGSVVVTINDYGEMDFELAAWILLGPLAVYGISLVAYSVWKEGRDNRKRLKRLVFGKEDLPEWL